MAVHMIKKTLITLVCVLLIVSGVSYLFKGQLWDKFQAIITADMFVPADTDSFSPGLAVGEFFPPIKALYQGNEVTSVDRFVHDKGMVFIANRSADW